MNLFLISPVARYKDIAKELTWLSEWGQRGEPTCCLLTTAQRRHLSSPSYTEHREGSARERPWTEEEEKTTFQNLEGEALEATAIGGCSAPAQWEGVSWKAGKPALGGEKGEQRINLEGIAGTQTQMFWQITPRPCGLQETTWQENAQTTLLPWFQI